MILQAKVGVVIWGPPPNHDPTAEAQQPTLDDFTVTDRRKAWVGIIHNQKPIWNLRIDLQKRRFLLDVKI